MENGFSLETMAGLAASAKILLEAKEHIKDLELQVESCRDELMEFLVLNNMDMFEIPVGEQESYIVALNSRTQKSFDKPSLSEELNVPVDLLNYKGISSLTQSGKMEPEDIDRHTKRKEISMLKVKKVVTEVK